MPAIRNLLIALGVASLLPACAGCDDDDPKGPDVTPPRVTNVDPDPGAEGVDPGTSLVVTFSEPIDLDSVTAESFRLGPVQSPVTRGRATPAKADNQLTYTPDEPLEYLTEYLAEVDSSLTDLAGNPMTEHFDWTFTTGLPGLVPANFPLASGNAWLYRGRTEDIEVDDLGPVTARFSGLRVLWVEGTATWDGEPCWLVRDFRLDESVLVASALGEDYFYVDQDDSGLYVAHPTTTAGLWQNVSLYGEPTFDLTSFLIAGQPLHSDGTTQSIEVVSVPAGDLPALSLIHSFTSDTGSEYIAELRREYIAFDRGPAAADWDYTYENDGVGQSDYYSTGAFELVDSMNGPSLPYITPEIEPSNGPGEGTAQEVTAWSIVMGEIHLADAHTVLTDQEVDCPEAICINPDIDGVKALQDWYRFEISDPGDYRFDLIYDGYDEITQGYNDLDLYLFRENGDGSLSWLSSSIRNPTIPEYIVRRNLEVGWYTIALQAWQTDGAAAEYTLSVRPQAVTKGADAAVEPASTRKRR